MKKRFLSFAIVLLFINQNLHAQDNLNSAPFKVYRIAVFAPLYLDSIFTDFQLKNDRSIPKFIQQSLEFVQGAHIAFDSLPLNNQFVHGYIYDSKSYQQPIPWLIKNKMLDSIDLIIGSVKDVDFKQLSDFSAKRNIPFISSTYPNDGGVTDNENLAIMNSTLRAHCEGIYSYILQNHGTDKVYLIKKQGQQEDKIAAYFKNFNEQEGKAMLNIQTLYVDSNISVSYLKNRLDSNHHSVIIGGSLDEAFAKQIADACYAATKKNYSITLIGMPNWDGFKAFTQKNTYKDFPIHFTTPYYNSKTSVLNTMLTNEYMRRFKTKVTDMACKGFESVYLFTNLLIKYHSDFFTHLNDKDPYVFNEFNFRPVYLKKNGKKPDYFENKHLYVMKILNGSVNREW